MARYTEDRNYASGAMILQEGSPVRAVHFVLSGSVHVTRRGLPLRRIEAGQSFGSLAALAEVQEGVTAEAIEDTHTLELSIGNLESVFLEHFDLLTAALRAMVSATIQERMKLPRAGYQEDVDAGSCPGQPMSLIERVVSLKNALFISQHRVEALLDLARGSREIRYRAGDRLWALGDRSPSVLHMVCGIIACETEGGAHFRFGAGGFLGAMDALTQEGRWFSARAETDAVVLSFDNDDFVDIIEDHAYMAMEMLRNVSYDLFTVLGSRRRYARDDSPL